LKIEGFIVHLQRATARRRQVDHLLKELPVETRVVEAVDGQALSDTQIAERYAKGLHKPSYPFELRKSEVACFLSHRKVWRTIVESDLDAGLIVEDDVALDVALFRRCFEVAKTVCAGKAYLQFQTRPVKGAFRTVVRTDGVDVLSPEVTQLRTSAQLVSREAARALLSISERFDRPVDTFLQMRWLTDIVPLCVVPSGVSDCTQQTGGSTIQGGKSPWQRVSREYHRFVYRRAVRHLSLTAAKSDG